MDLVERPQRSRTRPYQLKDYKSRFPPRLDLLEASLDRRTTLYDMAYAKRPKALETLQELLSYMKASTHINGDDLLSLYNLKTHKCLVEVEIQEQTEEATKAQEALVQCQLQLVEKKFRFSKSIAGSSVDITEGSSGVQLVDFTSRVCEQSFARRLSTVVSMTDPPPASDWGWYWMNDSGGWTEYRQQGRYDFSITSEELETMYQINSEQEVYFTSNMQNYLLRFKEMQQQNVESKIVREVCRRLRSDRRESPDSAAAASADIIVPSYWDKDRLPSFSYQIVDLDTNSDEYSRVATLFKNTMSDRIHSVKRVQNLSLWKIFQWQKERMVNGNGGKEVDQRYLFHGTTEYQMEQICQQNIDWRLCGLNGTRYGTGSYFARDASYSNRYVLPKEGIRKMFLSLVLVGEFTLGDEHLVRPPLKPNQSPYDSCINNENDPSIFVIFEKFQIYPEYIIEYSNNVDNTE